jgi:hypothetical protein
MNLAYVVYSLDSAGSGVSKKIANQVGSWVEAGHKVTVIRAGLSAHREGYEKANGSVGARLIYRPTDGAIGRWGRWLGLKKTLREETFDVVYHRFDLATPGLVAAMTGPNWALEINSNDRAEYALQPGLRDFYNRMTRNRALSRAAGAVFMTNELANHADFRAVRGRREVIANGADFKSISPLPTPPKDGPVELLFIGSDRQSWHGVDKLVPLAAARPEWVIHAVGVSKSMFPEGCPENIRMPGPLSREQYEPVAAKCTVGFGTLALHRKGMEEACALKVREYLALGLPVVLGNQDADIPNGAAYALQLPNHERNVAENVEKIEAFVQVWRGRRVPRSDVAHLDSAFKEKKRLALLTDLTAA